MIITLPLWARILGAIYIKAQDRFESCCSSSARRARKDGGHPPSPREGSAPERTK